jgi:glyoxylase-like metal-dependent hydrolase (beta-lactamase superfamily II)
LEWVKHDIIFIATPGHSLGSVCIAIDDVVFGGDTLMPFKPFIKKRNGGSFEQFQESIKKMINTFYENTIVYPGHGETGIMKDYRF